MFHFKEVGEGERGLPEGEMEYELLDPETERPIALLDLAWPEGVQEGLTAPVALLIDEGVETLRAASRGGFRAVTSVEAFKGYVRREIEGPEGPPPG